MNDNCNGKEDTYEKRQKAREEREIARETAREEREIAREKREDAREAVREADRVVERAMMVLVCNAAVGLMNAMAALAVEATSYIHNSDYYVSPTRSSSSSKTKVKR